MALIEEQRNPWRAIVAGGDCNLTSQDWEDLLTELDSLYAEAPIAQHASEQKQDLRTICITDENTFMMTLADRIVGNANPEEDSRLDVAYAIARHLKLDWPSAYGSPIAHPASECQCSMTTKLVGDGCVHCNPEYTTDHEAQPASDYKKLIAQLKDPEIYFPGNFDTVKRANAMLMCLCQEAADALSASAPSEQKPRFECWSTNEGDSWYDNHEDAELLYDVLGDSPKVGDEFEVIAGWYSVQARYRIASQTDDDFEVECISHPEDNTAPHPNYKAQRDALLDFANHIATSPKLVGTGWQEMAQTVVASVKGGAK